MDSIGISSINTFGKTPQRDFVPSDDPILEFPASELQALLNELVFCTYNQLAESRAPLRGCIQIVIPRSTKLAEALSYGKPIHLIDPEAPAAKAYSQLADEVVA